MPYYCAPKLFMGKLFFYKILFVFFLLHLSAIAFAQNSLRESFAFPAIADSDFVQQNYGVDTSAGAVFLIDAGQAFYESDNDGHFIVRQRTFKRIRLLKSNSFNELATVKIKLFVTRYFKIKLENFAAATYNKETGKIVSIPVDAASVFKEKDGDIQTFKFTFPGLKEGSIIEYKYDLVIPTYMFIPPWQFQESYPKLMSRYAVEIPSTYNFATIVNGFLNPVVDTVLHYDVDYKEIYRQPLSLKYDDGTKGNTVCHTWLYENIQALKQEKYVASLNNFAQSIEFYKLPGTVLTSSIFGAPGWSSAVNELMHSPGFSLSLSEPNGWLNNDLREAVGAETDPLRRAKSIYYYVKGNYTCTDHSAVFLSQELKETTRLKKGNVIDINMVLAALLLHDGFKAYPVLLSTRDNGKAADDYPILSRMNYVVIKAIIRGQTYFLDAAEPELGFGQLDNDCYNGNARLIDNPTSAINLSADSLVETSITNAFFVMENDTLSGNITTTLGNMESLALRKKMKTGNADEYLKEKKSSISLDADISNMMIDSLKLPEEPVTVRFDLSIKKSDEIMYLNPMFTEAITENPFAETDRMYPVEFPYCEDKTYVLNMEIPEDYEVSELPKPARISLNEDQGLFEYLIMSDGMHIQLRCRLKLNRANFLPEDYKTLREFYAFVVEKENEQIVFKKKK